VIQSYGFTLAKNGFSPETYCFEDTIIGWDYDVINAVMGPDSVFLEDSISNTRQSGNLEELLLCRLTLKPNVSIDSGIEYLLSVWKSELRYKNRTFEQINITTQNDQGTAHFLILSEHNAMTVKFVISLNRDSL